MERECADDGLTHWAEAHETLVQLARERGELEGREGRALLRAMRSGVHVHLGYGSFVEYVERLSVIRRAPLSTSCAPPKLSKNCPSSIAL